MPLSTCATCRPARPAAASRLARILNPLLAAVRCWPARRRDRRILVQLTERELQDIGMTPTDRSWLARRRFWAE